MSTPELVVTYMRGYAVVAYLYLRDLGPDDKVAKSREVRRGLVVDFAADGTPFGLEIINPGDNTPEELLEVLAEVSATGVTAEDLGPLRNAAKYEPEQPLRAGAGITRASVKANKRRPQAAESEQE